MKKMTVEIMAAGLLLATVAMTGCEIDTHKDGNGEHVKIATPFGGVQVKTDDAVVSSGIGIATYPGAELVKKGDDGKNNGAADINVSFGDFKVRVKAVSYRTNDSQDKVIAFYRKDLGKYGTVIQCNGDDPVGTPVKTTEGLTCGDDNTHAATDISSKMELKAGSRQHQHLVAIDASGGVTGGTKFALIALDLPIDVHIGSHDEGDK